ncbi:MAG: FAD-dependent oxidoreductase [Caldilineales bacterium]|nr:FAD-dependent oxidoreductase [Caldilineales bacterium]
MADTQILGTEERPLRVAVIGAGPSGFYAVQSLLNQKDLAVSVDIIDHLPAPYGLVRYGVAPDHQKIKSVTKVYDRIAADPRVRFFGNVTFGADLSHDDILDYYDQVVYAVGAQTDRRLDIPGEDLIGSYPATDFVAWYNGHPDYRHLEFDLSCESVAVIGVGNVAMDVARILALSPSELEETDIADYALEALRHSKVKDIYIIARRGPAQVKFTNPELRELAELEVTDVIINPAELELDEYSAASITDNREAQTNLDIMRHYAEIGDTHRQKNIHFLFLRSPVEIIGDDENRVVRVRLEKNELRPTSSGYLNSHGIGEYETVEVGMVMRSIGYRGQPLPGVPFHERWGVISNADGRVTVYETGEVVPREYVTGWIKRGPTGIIGTNKPDSVATVRLMMEDLPSLAGAPAENADPQAIVALLKARGIRFVTWDDWLLLDEAEVAAGEPLGRPRVKFTSIAAMFDALQQAIEAQIQDILIIGGGPAGLYAAFYAGLRNMKARVLEAMPVAGGQLSALYPELDIYDMPGFFKVGAAQLVRSFEEQTARFAPQVEICYERSAQSVSFHDGLIEIADHTGTKHRTRRLIIATGIGAITPNRLDNPSVAKFEGKGVYYFANDRAVFRGKRVLVVGGGDSAVLWALNLKDWADQVTLVHRRDKFRARDANVAELMESQVKIRTFHEVKEVKGKGKVESAVLVNARTLAEEEIGVDAIIFALGYRAESGPLGSLGLERDEHFIMVDGYMRTSQPGIYAIGDVAQQEGSVNLKLIATGLAQAAIAVNHACHDLRPDQKLIPPHSSMMRL